MQEKNECFKFSIMVTMFIGMLMGMLLIAGCQGQDHKQSLQRYVGKVNQRSATPIPPVPYYSLVAKYTYPEVARRNPFKPLGKKVHQGYGPDIKRKKQPLEVYPLDSLRMVGTLQEGKEIFALISTPDSGVFKVTIGDYVGKNYGRVVDISAVALKLNETIRIAGNWEKRPVKLNLEEETD